MSRESQIQRDYRKWLLAELEGRKAKNSSYSVRAFSRDLGISDTTLYRILSRERHLSPSAISTLEGRLELTAVEVESIRDQVSQGRSKQRYFDIALRSARHLIDDVKKFSRSSPYDHAMVSKLLENANDVFSELLSIGGDSADLKVGACQLKVNLAHAEIFKGNYERVIELAEEVEAELEQLLIQIPDNSDILQTIADAVAIAADAHMMFGRTRKYLQHNQKVVAIRTKLLAAEQTAERKGQLSIGCFGLGKVYLSKGDLQEAIAQFNKALELANDAGSDPDEGHLAYGLMDYAQGGLANCYLRMGQPERAEAYAAAATACRLQDVKVFPKGSIAKARLAESMILHATCFIAMAKTDQAERHLVKTKEIFVELDALSWDCRLARARYHEAFGNIYVLRKEFDSAQESFDAALDGLVEMTGKDTTYQYYVCGWARVSLRSIENLARLDRIEDSTRQARELLEFLRPIIPECGIFEIHYTILGIHSHLFSLATEFQENGNAAVGELAEVLKKWLLLFEDYPFNERLAHEFIAWTKGEAMSQVANAHGLDEGLLCTDDDISKSILIKKIKGLISALDMTL